MVCVVQFLSGAYNPARHPGDASEHFRSHLDSVGAIAIMPKSRAERRRKQKAEEKRLKKLLKSQEKSLSKEGHRNKESKSSPERKYSNAEQKVTPPKRRFSCMDITAIALAGLVALTLALFGILYSTHKTPAIVLFGLCVIFLDVEVCLLWLQKTWKDEAQAINESELHGLLLPANDPTPNNPCHEIPDGAMLILLGNSASFATRFPHTIIRVKGEDILTLTKKDNELAVSVKIFSRDGRIVAEIRDNEFSINPNNYFRRERPDRHTLIVYDQEDRKVLDVRFINPRTVRFLGIFNHPIRPIVISQTEGFLANTICLGNLDAEVVID